MGAWSCTLLCRLTSITCNNKSVQETFTFFISLYAFLLFSSFCCSTWILSVQLWHFHKIINKINIPISKNHHFVEKIIIMYKKLSFDINISSYLIGSFQNFLEEILTHNFFGIEVGLKLSFICTLEMVVGPLWKHSSLLTHKGTRMWEKSTRLPDKYTYTGLTIINPKVDLYLTSWKKVKKSSNMH